MPSRAENAVLKSSFIEGMASAFDLSGAFCRFRFRKSPKDADARALESDWRKVGDDLTATIIFTATENELTRIRLRYIWLIKEVNRKREKQSIRRALYSKALYEYGDPLLAEHLRKKQEDIERIAQIIDELAAESSHYAALLQEVLEEESRVEAPAAEQAEPTAK